MTKSIHITCPAGMGGLAVEPWSKGEIYAVAADWAQASCPVLVYGEDGWTSDEHGRQVADFRHSDRAALASIIREAIEAGGDEPDDDEVEGILDDAVKVLTDDVGAMVQMLESHGSAFAGNSAKDTAQDWLDADFDANEAGDWCDIGCWDADTANELRAAGLTPDQAKSAAERMVEDNGADDYTDGDPIYSACNGDTAAQEIIDAAQAD